MLSIYSFVSVFFIGNYFVKFKYVIYIVAKSFSLLHSYSIVET